MSKISPEPYFHPTNFPSWNRNFRAFQNLVDEHSAAGVPASLYNLTKSVPDPSILLLATEQPQCLKDLDLQ